MFTQPIGGFDLLITSAQTCMVHANLSAVLHHSPGGVLAELFDRQPSQKTSSSIVKNQGQQFSFDNMMCDTCKKNKWVQGEKSISRDNKHDYVCSEGNWDN